LREDLPGLRSEEAAVLALLQQRLSREIERRGAEVPRSGRELEDTLRRSVKEGDAAASVTA
jgi:hypothetical protein